MKQYAIMFYFGPYQGWVFHCEPSGSIMLFDTKDDADKHVKSMGFKNNEFIYKITETKNEIK